MKRLVPFMTIPVTPVNADRYWDQGKWPRYPAAPVSVNPEHVVAVKTCYVRTSNGDRPTEAAATPVTELRMVNGDSYLIRDTFEDAVKKLYGGG